MCIKINVEDNALLVEVSGELDLVVAENFKKEVERALLQNDLNNLILDLSELRFIDSSGLGALLGRYKTIKQRNGKLLMINVNPNVKKILELSGILRILNVYPDLKAAISTL